MFYVDSEKGEKRSKGDRVNMPGFPIKYIQSRRTLEKLDTKLCRGRYQMLLCYSPNCQSSSTRYWSDIFEKLIYPAPLFLRKPVTPIWKVHDLSGSDSYLTLLEQEIHETKFRNLAQQKIDCMWFLSYICNSRNVYKQQIKVLPSQKTWLEKKIKKIRAKRIWTRCTSLGFYE